MTPTLTLAAFESRLAPTLEREREIEAIDRAVERALDGRGTAITIVGEAGIGKSTLLRHAADTAAQRGFRVLRAQGGELERALPYGIVIQLFDWLARDAELAIEVLTGPAKVAVSLLGLGPGSLATRSDVAGVESGDPLAYLHGLHWLTVNLAERGPVAILVDDAQWADEPSMRVLHRLMDQVDELPAVVVLAMRPDSGSPASVAGTLVRSHPRATRLAPSPLTEGAVGRLLSGVGDRAIDPRVRRACWQATSGNPFFVTELARELEESDPDRSLVDQLASAVPERVGRSVEARLVSGGPAARGVAEAAAVLGESATLQRAARLAGIDPSAAELAARWLVDAAILEDSARLGFRHPIVRSAVDAGIPGPARAALHRRAAFLLSDEGADAGVAGAHLLETEPAGDPRTVGLLRAASGDALARGEAETAVTLLRRALGEPAGAELAEIRVDLARAEAQAGSPHAAAAYVDALELTADRRRRATLLLELGHVLVRGGDFAEATSRFRQGIRELGNADDPLHAKLEAGFVATAWMGGVPDATANSTGARILSEPVFGPAHRELVASVAFQRSISGSARCEEMVGLVDRILAEAPLEQLVGEGQLIQLLTGVLFSSDELERHHELLTSAIVAAERSGDYARIGLYSAARGWSDYLTGRLDEAIADTDTAIRAGGLGWEVFFPATVAIHAITNIEREELDDAEAVLQVDPAAWSSRADWVASLVARARLSAAQGNLDRALVEFEAAAEFGERFSIRNPGPPAWRRWQVAALVQHGDVKDARRIAAEAVEIAEAWGARWPLATALWAAGLAEPGRAGIALLRRAEVMLHGNEARLEAARVLVDLGAALRRHGSLTEARQTLSRAADLAHRLGATALRSRAVSELHAAGSRPRRLALSGLESLTPAELRVAREAAAGRTNRQIAQALFVTPKAVEFHLANTYQKLGIAGRGELAAAMGR